MEKVQEDVQRSLNRAAHRETEVRSLMNAVSGSNDNLFPSLKASVASSNGDALHHLPRKPRTLRQAADLYSGDTNIEEEAREAGAKSLYERDPLDHPMPLPGRSRVHSTRMNRRRRIAPTTISALATSTAGADSKPAGAVKNVSDSNTSKPIANLSKTNSNLRGISNPRGYLRNDDRYVPSGAVLDRDAFLKKYLSPETDDVTQANTTETGSQQKAANQQQQQKWARQQELASVSWPGLNFRSRSNAPAQAAAARLQGLNTPEAPTLDGGIPVPGGHIIWVPETSLSRAQPAAEPAMGPAPAAAMSNSRETASIVQPTQAGPAELVLPLPVTAYSKVVAYGPDGHREFIWYRPAKRTSAAPASRQGTEEEASKHRVAPQEKYSMTSTGALSGSVGRKGRGAERGRVFSAKDRRIERDLLLRLMSTPGQDDAVSSQSSASEAGRQQQLVQVSAAAPAAGPGRLQRALLATAAASLLVCWSGRMLR